MWTAIIVILVVIGVAVSKVLSSRMKERERRNATKGLVEARINTVLATYAGFAGLDAPETARVLALRAAVRQGKLIPIVR